MTVILRREILGDYGAIRAIRAEIIAIAEEHGVGGDKLFEIKLRIEEALIDAIKRFGARARFRVEAEIDAFGVTIVVEEVR